MEHYGVKVASFEISKESLGNQIKVSCRTEIPVGTPYRMMPIGTVGVEPKRGPQKGRATQNVKQLLGRAIGIMPYKPWKTADISVQSVGAAMWTNKASWVEG